MKEFRQEYQRKPEAEGNLSALIGSKENGINGKQKDRAQEETLVVFATVRINVEKQRNRPLLHQNRRLKAMGKILRGRSLRGVRLERVLEDRAKTSSVGKCTNPSCDSWHLPVFPNSKTESGCRFGKNAPLCTERLTGSPTKNRRRLVVKVLLRISSKYSVYSRM